MPRRQSRNDASSAAASSSAPVVPAHAGRRGTPRDTKVGASRGRSSGWSPTAIALQGKVSGHKVPRAQPNPISQRAVVAGITKRRQAACPNESCGQSARAIARLSCAVDGRVVRPPFAIEEDCAWPCMPRKVVGWDALKGKTIYLLEWTRRTCSYTQGNDCAACSSRPFRAAHCC